MSQDNLNSFLSLASDFQIEGIGDNGGLLEEEPEQEPVYEANLIEDKRSDDDEFKTDDNSIKGELDTREKISETEFVDLVADEKKASRVIEPVKDKDEFTCRTCEYSTNRKVNLRIHINSVHNEVRYPCGKCKYQATQQSHLYRHNRTRHTLN